MQCETVSGGLHGNALIIATAKKMIQQGAIKSSYRGLTMGLLGMFPYSAIDLGTFEYLKGRIARRNAKILGCHEEDAHFRVRLVPVLSILSTFSEHDFKHKALFSTHLRILE
jgi:hypothetical protein